MYFPAILFFLERLLINSFLTLAPIIQSFNLFARDVFFRFF